MTDTSYMQVGKRVMASELDVSSVGRTVRLPSGAHVGIDSLTFQALVGLAGYSVQVKIGERFDPLIRYHYLAPDEWVEFDPSDD